MEQLSFIPDPALCNRCNAEHNRARCENCGCPEYRLTGREGRLVREAGRVKPKKKKRHATE